MNLFLGVVIGVLLTIGTAFIADAFTTAEVTSEMCPKQIVNWDVAKERLHEFRRGGIASKVVFAVSSSSNAICGLPRSVTSRMPWPCSDLIKQFAGSCQIAVANPSSSASAGCQPAPASAKKRKNLQLTRPRANELRRGNS